MHEEQRPKLATSPRKPNPAAQRKPRRRRRPKGVPGWWGRLRSLIWSWWLWAAAAVFFHFDHHSGIALVLIITAFLMYLSAPREGSPAYGLEHEFAIGSEEFLSTVT